VIKHFAKTITLVSCLSALPAYAVDSDAVLGGALGGGIGAAVGSEVGGREGAIAGGAVGAAIGTAVMTDGKSSHSGGIRVEASPARTKTVGPPPHAYNTPPGHVKNGKQHKWK